MKFGRLVTGALATACFGLTLSGCGSDSNSGPVDPVALTGTAAVGAPLANAAVTLRCGAGDNVEATTNAQGVYKVLQSALTAAAAEFPCAVKVMGEVDGEPVTLFSFAAEAGRVNVTPLTDLAVAAAANNLAGVEPAAWFAAEQFSVEDFDTALNEAADGLQTALLAAAGEQQLPFDIFSTNFAADGVSVYDQWLDRLNEALEEAGVGYVDFAASYVSGGGFGTIVIDLTPDTDGEGGGNGGGDGGATTDLHLTVTVMGQTTPETVVEDVPAPTAEGEFCGGMYSEYIGADGVLNITSCSFSGNRGEIHATVSSPGLPMPISYVAVYEWR